MAQHGEDTLSKEKTNKKRVKLFWTSLSFIERSYSRTQNQYRTRHRASIQYLARFTLNDPISVNLTSGTLMC